MVTSEREHSFQHPALGAAMAARNAVSAEMAVAGRARHDPGDRAWATALGILDDHTDGDVRGAHADRLMRLSTRLGGGAPESHAPHAARTSELEAVRRPAARRRRERLETTFWFAVGGAGGLLLAFGVRMVEVMLAWR